MADDVAELIARLDAGCRASAIEGVNAAAGKAAAWLGDASVADDPGGKLVAHVRDAMLRAGRTVAPYALPAAL
jgi:hypothetical protein